jgi:hypothetical protein
VKSQRLLSRLELKREFSVASSAIVILDAAMIHFSGACYVKVELDRQSLARLLD